MLPDELFEHLHPVYQDVEPFPDPPDPASGQMSCTWLCPSRVFHEYYLSGLADAPSGSFEILPEELRYIRHPHHDACPPGCFSATPNVWESGVIV